MRRSSNNNSGYLSDDDDGLSDGECDHSDVDRLLETLEQLDDELVSDVGELSEDLAGDRVRRSYRRYPTASSDRVRAWDDVSLDEAYWRWPVSFAPAPAAFAPANTVWRQPAHAFTSRGMTGIDSAYASPLGADLYAPAATSRLFSSASRPYPQRCVRP